MRKLWILLFFIPFNSVLSQQNPRPGNFKKPLISDSTVVQRLEELKDSMPVTGGPGLAGPEEISESVSRNMEGILQLQREREAKQKKAALVRIAIGLGFLALLVVGWMRRRKK